MQLHVMVEFIHCKLICNTTFESIAFRLVLTKMMLRQISTISWSIIITKLTKNIWNFVNLESWASITLSKSENFATFQWAKNQIKYYTWTCVCGPADENVCCTILSFPKCNDHFNVVIFKFWWQTIVHLRTNRSYIVANQKLFLATQL